MFDFIRTHQKLMQIVLLILIVPPFAFFGVDGYRRMSDPADAVAKVGTHSVTQLEFQNAQRQQMDRLRRMLGNQFDPKMLDSAEARDTLLDGLVMQRVMLDHSQRSQLTASDDKLRETIAALPSVQKDGKFDNDTYKALLTSQSLTPQRFEAQLRQDLAVQLVQSGVSDTGIGSKALLDKVLGALEQEREVQEVSFKADAFAAKVTVMPEAMQKYYADNKKEFAVPAQVKAELVQMSAAAFSTAAKPAEDDVKKYYDINQSKYVQAEQRQASHILIAADKDKKDERAKAKTKAEEILKTVKAAPDTFAEVAKKESQDPGSAPNGGDLGQFGKGAMVPTFEKAAFALKVNEISDVVETDFGYHVIRMTAIQEAKGKTLAEVRGEIEVELKKQAGQKKLLESVEKFQNLAYEQPDSLKPVTEGLGLPLGTTALFSKEAPVPPFAPAPGAQPSAGATKLLAAIFSDDAIVKKRNTEAVEVSPGNWVTARVVEHKPASTRSFEEAKKDIEASIKTKESAALAKQEGEARLADAQKNVDAIQYGAAKTVSRLKPDTLFGEPIAKIMAAPSTTLPVVVGVDLGAQGYAIYRINKVAAPAKSEEGVRKNFETQLARLSGTSDFEAYLSGLKKQSKVEIYKANLNKPATP